MVTDELVRLLEVNISQWLQENFGETLDCVIEEGYGTLKYKSKRVMVLTCLYMLDVDQVTIARILRVHPATIKTWYKSRDTTTTAAALDMYAFVADKVSSFFEEHLLEAKSAHLKLRSVARQHELKMLDPAVSQFDNTANEIYGYYVKRLRNAAISFNKQVIVKQPMRVAHANC